MAKRKRVLISSDSSADSDGDDLEKDLLALAKKKTKDDKGSPSNKKSQSQSLDSASSSSDNSDEEWTGNAKKGSRKKRKTRHTKRVRQASSDSEQDEQDDSEPEEGEVLSNGSDGSDSDMSETFDDGFDDHLMGDEEDKARLESMTEKEREQVIYERLERREVLRTRFDIEKKLRREKRKESKKVSKRDSSTSKSKKATRRSSITAGMGAASERQQKIQEDKKGSKKAQAMKDLKAKREERKKTAEQNEKDVEKKQPLKTSDIYSDDEEDKSSISSVSSSDSASDRSDVDSDNEDHETRGDPIRFIDTKAELSRIQISRYKMERLCHAPFFEEAVKGGFVRIGIGSNGGIPVYRVCQIVGIVETGKVYNLNKTRTNRGLRLRFANQERTYRLEFVSNSQFSDTEFEKWRYEMDRKNLPLPTMEEVTTKVEEINKFLTFKFSEEDVDQMVKEKKRFRRNPYNYASEKAQLLSKRAEAELAGNMTEMQGYDDRLAELDEKARELDRMRNDNTFSVMYINKKNRKENEVMQEKALLKEAQDLATEGERDDPFTRRKCQPQMVTKVSSKLRILNLQLEQEAAVKKKQEEEEARKLLEGKKTKAINEVESIITNHANPTAPPSSRPLPAVTPNKTPGNTTTSTTKPNVDLYSAHNFDVDIQVDFPTIGGSPTTNSASLLQTPGESMSLSQRRSLKLDEYKKRKGLI